MHSQSQQLEILEGKESFRSAQIGFGVMNMPVGIYLWTIICCSALGEAPPTANPHGSEAFNARGETGTPLRSYSS